MTAFLAWLDTSHAATVLMVGFAGGVLFVVGLIRAFQWASRGVDEMIAAALALARSPAGGANPAVVYDPIEAPGLGTGPEGIMRDARMLPAFREHCQRMDEAVQDERRRIAANRFDGGDGYWYRISTRDYQTVDELMASARIAPDGRLL